MIKNLKFSHKILLAASLVVLTAFSFFSLYNDYLQRNAIKADLENYLNEIGNLASDNIKEALINYVITRSNATRQTLTC